MVRDRLNEEYKAFFIKGAKVLVAVLNVLIDFAEGNHKSDNTSNTQEESS